MALTTALNEMRVRDNVTYALEPCKSINNYVLAANTSVNITMASLTDVNGIVPKALLFSCTGNFYVAWNSATATVPASNITNGTGLELNPAIRHVGSAITQFSVIAPTACVLSIDLYSQIN